MANWIESLINQTSYFGVALLMLLENVFPPIPSELVMPLAGYTASQGQASIVLVILAGTVGSVGGAVFWYLVGRWIGEDRLKRFSRRYGRWLTLTPQDIDHANQWFGRHGGKAVLIGRLIPTVRTLISIPAGICGMPWVRFLIYSSLGTAIWTAVLALAGYTLGSQYEAVSKWVGPVSNGIFAVILAWYLYRVVTFRRQVEA